MPRPGPRPYDCVRRAWHSDTHQPIRGTLIQEIFRVVNEIHGPATKKNKEYQEKLPIVVLRAEEIMYCKANSEAEYMDLTTLLVRANDAIDTVIRRDESTETGEHLQPCIEAALCLGCTPVKASRSQRNSPRCYLNPTVQESVQKPAIGDHIAIPHFVSPCSNIVKSTRLGSEYPSKKQCLEYHQSLSNSFSVYPLYYGNNIPVDKSVYNTSGVTNHLSPNVTASNQKPKLLIGDDPDENQPTMGYDLSLRLGPLSSVEERKKLSGETCQNDKKKSLLCGTDQRCKNARQISFI
ncbi:hypothetical protein QN277_015212 [Acacia crassicarpa]|uniref:Histone acetyltransferase n=1 Tax=Acacia crassicarpa TaxID=499986 RepID=A0AAE1JVB3_9FABA|nr:hypothetical protein QN277_015212 [Acacia crassicarpa]